MKYIWCPLFFGFFLVEFFNTNAMCGSDYITGKMWLMWLVMSLMNSKIYIESWNK